jgi:hypothetical protein
MVIYVIFVCFYLYYVELHDDGLAGPQCDGNTLQGRWIVPTTVYIGAFNVMIDEGCV